MAKQFPTIADARQLGKRYQLDGIIIIAVDRAVEQFSIVSYGKDRARCQAYGRCADRMTREVEQGLLQLPMLPLEEANP